MWERISQGHVVDPDADTGDTLVRFNQGWIIARIMTHVPAAEPYAMGQTLVDAAIFTVVPRFLVPSKRDGASTELFFRFTGIKLPPNTRMGLGVIGEFYANFGVLGGVLATFVYGCMMGGCCCSSRIARSGIRCGGRSLPSFCCPPSSPGSTSKISPITWSREPSCSWSYGSGDPPVQRLLAAAGGHAG